MFWALPCPSSGARQTAIAASGFLSSACFVGPDGCYRPVQFLLDVFVRVYISCLFSINEFWD